MSAAFLDYDNDGLLDIYTGNMWSAPGLYHSAPTFMPDAAPDVRALYRRHVRGNSLFRNLGNGRFEDKTLEARADGPLGMVVGRGRCRQRRVGLSLIVNGMLTRQTDAGGGDLEGFFWRQSWPALRSRACPGTPKMTRGARSISAGSG